MKRAVFTGCALLSALVLAMLPDFAPAAGSVTVGMQLEPPILDPTASPAAAISEALYGNLFEGLVQFAADGSVLPQLAGSWPDLRCIRGEVLVGQGIGGGLGESAEIAPSCRPGHRCDR